MNIRMKTYPVTEAPEEILRAKCEPVESADEARAIIIELQKAYQTQENCLGLAAPQIGISKAVSIIRDRDNGTSIDLINPEILEMEEE